MGRGPEGGAAGARRQRSGALQTPLAVIGEHWWRNFKMRKKWSNNDKLPCIKYSEMFDKLMLKEAIPKTYTLGSNIIK
jgi:hypothetical protein